MGHRLQGEKSLLRADGGFEVTVYRVEGHRLRGTHQKVAGGLVKQGREHEIKVFACREVTVYGAKSHRLRGNSFRSPFTGRKVP
jgi:hypothetical protein